MAEAWQDRDRQEARHRQFRAQGRQGRRQADKAGKVQASGQGKGTRKVGFSGKAGAGEGRTGAGRGGMGESQAACYMVVYYFIWWRSISPSGPIAQNLAAERGPV